MLNAKHSAELRASGIADELIVASGIRSISSREAHDILKWNAGPGSRDMSGYAIPFFANGETAAGYTRVKADNPRTNGNGKYIKYESPRGKSNRAYLPPGFSEALLSARTILITEGEKKSLSAMSHGYPCIGLVGVWGWQRKRKQTDSGRKYGKRELIADLAAIEWKGRQVCIIFDSDAATNDLVLLAEYKFAETLQSVGAVVSTVRLPSLGDNKTGLDDFLVAKGAAELQRLIDAAEPAEKPPDLNSMDVAKLFLADQYATPTGHSIRWWNDEFWRWSGRAYSRLPDGDLKLALVRWSDERLGDAKPRAVGDAMTCLGSLVQIPYHVEQPAYLGSMGTTKPNWIAMRNGIFDLGEFAKNRKAKILPHTANYFTPVALPYAYDAQAVCNTWFKTLDEIFDGDEERVDLLAEWFGYCLTDDTSHQAILVCEGPKRSGKGTVFRALRQTVGADNCVSPRLFSLGEMFGLMGLVGKRVALCPDAHLGRGDRALGVLETLKLISGEDAVEVHRKHRDPITIRLRVKIAMAVNELPKFGDSAGALASRVLILPFRRTFKGYEDRTLEAKLDRESAGILNWALDGLLRLQANGRFTKPAISQQIEADFERLSSPLKAFLDDRCTLQPDAHVERDSLWEAWSKWCDDNGHLRGSRELLGSRLRALVIGLSESRPRISDGRTRVYNGIGLQL